jgi:hypothetical protein
MNTITKAVIETRLREAAALRRMVINTSQWNSPESNRREYAHTIEAVAETLSWLDWLGSEDAALVRARLEGARWKAICFRFGISRPTAYRRWRHALALIAWRLNGHEPPANYSRRRFMQMATPSM